MLESYGDIMEQINKNKKTFKLLLIIGVITIIPALILAFTMHQFMFLVFYPVLAVLGLALFYNFKIIKPFKENIIPEILKNIDPNINYIPKPNREATKPLINIIKQHKLIPSASTFNFSDCITTSIKGYNLTSYDLHATHTQSNGKSSTTVTDFKGRIYDIEYPKLACDFLIKEETLKRIPNGYEFLELEHIESNKAFNIYVTDKVDAFKVFTPSVIKDYYELAGIDSYKTITHYHNHHLYVYVYNNKNIFETITDDFETKIIEEYQEQHICIEEYLNVFTYIELE